LTAGKTLIEIADGNYHRLPAMDNQRLRELCEQASKEQDSTRLMELGKEIVRPH